MSKSSLFVATQLPGCTYYRMASFIKYMKAELWPKRSLEALPNWEDAIVQNIDVLYELEKEAQTKDVLVFQRIKDLKGLAVIQALKWKHRKKVLVEIDDDALHVDSNNPGFASLRPGSESVEAFEKQLKEADGVITSTEYLKKVYKHYNKKVYVVPNAVDFSVWDKLKKKPHKKLRIGWQGGQQHFEDLGLLLPVIPKILKEHKVEFHFFGYMPDCFKIEGCFYHPPVPIASYPNKMAELNFDIVIAPLVDTPMNRGRSNLRVLEAGALKKPVIASGNRHLPYAEIIRDGAGVFANSTSDWVSALKGLIVDERTRNSFGLSLYNSIKKFSLKEVSMQYQSIIDSV